MERISPRHPSIHSEPLLSENMKAADKLKELWDVMKKEGNCIEYITEMLTQLELLGTESGSLTKEVIRNKMEKVLKKITKSLEP